MTTLSFKISDSEARAIRAQARRERLSVSEFLRRRARALPAAPQKPKLVRCPITGAMIFEGMKEQPALTTERVKEMLADFP